MQNSFCFCESLIMTKDEIKEIRHTGWNYGWYDDDCGSNNPYDENSNEFLVHEFMYSSIEEWSQKIKVQKAALQQSR